MTHKTANTMHDNLNEVEELRARLEAMKRLIDDDTEQQRRKKNSTACKDSIIDGKFLSIIFMVVLLLIICVSFYAFYNLFFAVWKKFFSSKRHTEL